jgi:signal transduction histidine kinase
MKSDSYLSKFRRAPRRQVGGLMSSYCQQLGNIVDRRRAELALKAAKTSAELAQVSAVQAMVAAQTANRTKSEFLANISHELRTPLNAIIGFSQVMDDEILGPIGVPRYREYAKDIGGSAQHLLRIINDILDLCQIEAGKMRLVEEWLAIEDVIAAGIGLVAERARSAGLAISFERSGSRVEVLIDDAKIEQILLKVLSNAVKFSRPGGTVRVQSKVLPDGRFQIKVSDTGIGIPADQLERVFDPFVQIDSALDRKYEGTGLGLSLTRRLVELHGGTIELDSTIDVGTTAIIELPAERVSRPLNQSKDIAGEMPDRTSAVQGARG